MSSFLIDTNVLSEYRRPGGPDAGVKHWLETTEVSAQYVSVITLAEIQKASSYWPKASAASNSKRGSSKTWKLGLQGVSFPLTEVWPRSGHPCLREERDEEDLCRQSIH